MCLQLYNISRLCGTSTMSLRSYSSVMHTLMLLSKLSIGGCDLIDYPALTFLMEIKHLVRSFLGNPIIYVRQLAAKTYAAIISPANIQLEIETIRETLLNCDINTSYGYLLIRRYLKDKLNECMQSFINVNYKETKDHNGFNFENRMRHLNILKTWNNMCKRKKVVQPCYMLEILFLQESIADGMFCADSLLFHCNLPMIEDIILMQKIQPGFFQFVGLWARLYAVYLKRKLNVSLTLHNSDRKIICDILNSNCIELSIEFLNSLSYCIPLLRNILRHLISMQKDCHQLLIDEMVTFILRTIKHINSYRIDVSEFEKIIEEFNQTETIMNSNLIRIRNSLILAFSSHETLMNEILSYIFHMCTDEKQSARLIVTEYIELVLCRFMQLGNDNKLIVIRCCLILLKDEIAEIREIVSMSLQKYIFCDHDADFTIPCRLKLEEVAYQCLLRELFCHRFETIVEEDNFIQYFTRSIQDNIKSNVVIENPFSHDNSTFHREESKFLNMYSFFARFREDEFNSDDNNAQDCFNISHAIQIGYFKKLREKAGLIYNNLRVILYIKEMNYLVRKRDIIMRQ